jgi:hypothetical protein
LLTWLCRLTWRTSRISKPENECASIGNIEPSIAVDIKPEVACPTPDLRHYQSQIRLIYTTVTVQIISQSGYCDQLFTFGAITACVGHAISPCNNRRI